MSCNSLPEIPLGYRLKPSEIPNEHRGVRFLIFNCRAESIDVHAASMEELNSYYDKAVAEGMPPNSELEDHK